MKRRGLTLIEVVAALVLVGASAGALLVAQSRSMAQLETTRRRAVAAALAEGLIRQWQIECPPEAILEGRFDSHASWRWRRTSRPYAKALHIELNEIALSVEWLSRDGQPQAVASYTWIEKRVP